VILALFFVNAVLSIRVNIFICKQVKKMLS
jgi:hypothetical protein